MSTIIITKKYKIYNETSYHLETPDVLIYVLNSLRQEKTRVKIILGNPETGEAWGDIETGYIGRSKGTYKIPLVVYNKRSSGGGGLLSHCILRIEPSKKTRRHYYLYSA